MGTTTITPDEVPRRFIVISSYKLAGNPPGLRPGFLEFVSPEPTLLLFDSSFPYLFSSPTFDSPHLLSSSPLYFPSSWLLSSLPPLLLTPSPPFLISSPLLYTSSFSLLLSSLPPFLLSFQPPLILTSSTLYLLSSSPPLLLFSSPPPLFSFSPSLLLSFSPLLSFSSPFLLCLSSPSPNYSFNRCPLFFLNPKWFDKTESLILNFGE